MGIDADDTDLDMRLAHRIATVRRQRGLTLEELASRSGVSRATLSRIERGETSPTAHVLGGLCGVFGLTMSQLLLGAEAEAASLVRASAAPVWLDPETGFRRTSVSPPTPGYAVEIIRGTLPPGATIRYDRAPISGLEHHVVVLAGTLALTLDGQRHVLEAGDCLRYRLAGASGFENPGTLPVTYFVVIRTPS